MDFTALYLHFSDLGLSHSVKVFCGFLPCFTPFFVVHISWLLAGTPVFRVNFDLNFRAFSQKKLEVLFLCQRYRTTFSSHFKDIVFKKRLSIRLGKIVFCVAYRVFARVFNSSVAFGSCISFSNICNVPWSESSGDTLVGTASIFSFWGDVAPELPETFE